jgi:hypothetical protein
VIWPRRSYSNIENPGFRQHRCGSPALRSVYGVSTLRPKDVKKGRNIKATPGRDCAQFSRRKVFEMGNSAYARSSSGQAAATRSADGDHHMKPVIVLPCPRCGNRFQWGRINDIHLGEGAVCVICGLVRWTH